MTEGILLVNKPKDKTSFYLVHVLRRVTGIRKIGHAGTLDPLATGVMVMLIGSTYTKKTSLFIKHDKEYETTLLLGKISDTYDIQGAIQNTSTYVPSLAEVTSALTHFQGTISQTPPMFSAKKQNGQKLYDLARKGITVERKPIQVTLSTTLLFYEYPFLRLHIACSSGTYIRTIAHNLGQILTTGALVSDLTRTRSGPYLLTQCHPIETLTPLTFSGHLHA